MKNFNKFNKLVGAFLIVSLGLSPVSIFAQSKTETIYTNLKSDGKRDEVVVTNHLYYDGKKDFVDSTELKEILNISGEEKYEKKGSKLYWDMNKKDILYQGKTDKVLPIDVSVKYYLNGKEVNPSKIVGKKGKIKVVYSYKNNEVNNVNGKTLYTPFVVTLGTIFDSKENSKFEIDNGKMVSTGNRTMAVGIVSPGLYDSTGFDEFKGFDKITLSYETKKFSMGDVYMVVTPKLIDNSDFEVFNKMDSAFSKVDVLNSSAKELEDGAKKLSKGASKLDKSSKKINESLGTVLSSVESLKDGSYLIDDGLSKILSTLKSAKSDLNSSSNDESISNLKLLQSSNTKAINSTLSKTGLSYEDLQNYYVSNNLSAYSGDDENLLKIKDAYELIYLLGQNNAAIDRVLANLNDINSEINDMIDKLEYNLNKLSKGSNELNSGLNKLYTGTEKLYNGSSLLSRGASELSDGTSKLSKGMSTFKSDGIDKISSYAKNIKSKVELSKELVELSNNYKGFTSSDGDETTFVYKINNIK